MATAATILAAKGNQVWTVDHDATVFQAAQIMNDNGIGAVVVMDGDGIAGMFTERDLLRRVVGQRRDPATTRVADVMSAEVACCTPATTLEEARGAMKNRRIRHLPVVDEFGRLTGLISIGDVNAHQTADQEQTIHIMHEYLYGRA